MSIETWRSHSGDASQALRDVVHVVLFRFVDGIDWSDPRTVVAEAATRSHPEHIPSIGSWRCGRDTSGRSGAADFVLVATFASDHALELFQQHPDHQRGKTLWAEIATWQVADLPVLSALDAART